MASQARVIVVLKAPKGRLAFVEWAKHILASLTKNSSKFSKLTPSIAVFKTHVEALDSAHVKTFTRTKGTAQSRDAAMVAVKTDLKLLQASVQQDVAFLEPDAGVALAKAAGMLARVVAVRTIPELELRNTDRSGIVLAIAKGAKGMTHYFEYDIGQGPVELVPQRKTRIFLPWIAPGTTVSVRHKLLTPKGFTDWCEPVKLVVN